MDATTARQILGVSSSASEADIREAYRKKVREEHPDQSDEVSEIAQERFKNIQTARDLLLSTGEDETDADRNGPQSNTTESRTSKGAYSDPRGSRSTNAGADPRGSRSTNAGADPRGSRSTNAGADPRGSRSTNASDKREQKTKGSYRTSSGYSSRTEATERPTGQKSSGVIFRGVTGIHFPGWGALTATEKKIVATSVGTIMYIFTVVFLEPIISVPHPAIPIGIWIGLCGYIGHLLGYDEGVRNVLARNYNLRGLEEPIATFGGLWMPASALIYGFLLLIPVWIGVGFALGLSEELANRFLSANAAFADDMMPSVSQILEAVIIFYPPVVGLWLVGREYVARWRTGNTGTH